jgi:acid stress-induced BolA-like protein IbaG/YrbA
LNAEQVSALVSSAFEDGEVQVDGAGANYTITVISDAFDGKRPVARQQAVYAALREAIGSGAIHAVNIQTHTRKEWAAAQD